MSNESVEFLRPRLIGSRFNQHGLPLDVLKDFSVFGDMVKSVAKALYKKEHEGKRLPFNFLNDLSLQITKLEEGSTIANICCVNLLTSMLFDMPSIGQEYVTQARDCIIHTIDRASQQMPLDESNCMTRQQLAFFNRFGCSLQEGESISFPTDNANHYVSFTPDTRKFLVNHACLAEYRQSTTVYGAISELDQDKQSCTINLLNGRRLTVQKYNAEMEDDIVEAFSKYKSGQKVRLTGIGIFTRNDKLNSLESIDDIVLLDVMDIGFRLAEIAELKDGWLEGNGTAFDKRFLKQFETLFHKNYCLKKIPYLYPTADGTVQAEWDILQWKVSLEINPQSFKADFFAFHPQEQQEQQQVLDLSNPEGWKILCNTLNALEKEC